jgi:hypothetical protein
MPAGFRDSAVVPRVFRLTHPPGQASIENGQPSFTSVTARSEQEEIAKAIDLGRFPDCSDFWLRAFLFCLRISLLFG